MFPFELELKWKGLNDRSHNGWLWKTDTYIKGLTLGHKVRKEVNKINTWKWKKILYGRNVFKINNYWRKLMPNVKAKGINWKAYESLISAPGKDQIALASKFLI